MRFTAPRRFVRAIGVLTLAAIALPQCGDNPLYSKACRDLATHLGGEIDARAAAHAGCVSDDDCVLAVAIVACDRETARTVALGRADVEAYRLEIASLDASCTPSQVSDCNAYCGSTGSLLLPAPIARCVGGACALDPVDGLASPEDALAVPDAELCRPTRHVYLPEDLTSP